MPSQNWRPSLISVIIPVYNGERFLAEALDSVLGQENELEVLVLNDGSTDSTEQVAKSYGDRIRYLTHPNKGYVATRNRGIQESRGDLIAFLDADDVWPDGRLRKLTDELDRSTDIVVGRLCRTVADGEGEFQPLEEAQQALSLGAGLFRRSVFDRVGLLDESLAHHDDIEFFLRAQQSGIVVKKIDDITLLYRRHETNMTNDEAATQATLPSALHRIIQLRRAQRVGDQEQP